MKKLKIAAALICAVAFLVLPSSANAADTVTVCVTIGDDAVRGASEGTSVLDGFIYELEKANMKVTFFIDSENMTFSPDFMFAVMALRVGSFPYGILAEDNDTILKWMNNIKTACGEPSFLVMAVDFYSDGLFVCQPDIYPLTQEDFGFISSYSPSGAMLSFPLTAEYAQYFFGMAEELYKNSGTKIAYLTRYGEIRVPQ